MKIDDRAINNYYGSKLFSIGNNVDFGFANPQSVITMESPIIITNNIRIDCDLIGAYSFINENVTIRHTESIGRFCSIAPGAYIGLVDHPIESLSTSDFFYGKSKWEIFAHDYLYEERFNVNRKAKVIIGNDVWIGMNALVMRGVKLADGTIIAAGAVVTKDTEPYEIVGGVPARHIRYRFEEDVCKGLQSSEWWKYDVCVWNGKHISEATVALLEGLNETSPKMCPHIVRIYPIENRWELIQ